MKRKAKERDLAAELDALKGYHNNLVQTCADMNRRVESLERMHGNISGVAHADRHNVMELLRLRRFVEDLEDLIRVLKRSQGNG